MTYTRTDFWREVVSDALCEHGVTASDTQIAFIATDIQGCAENMDMAVPAPSGPSPERRELENLREELKRERNKVICTGCGGSGQLWSQGPYHGSFHTCWKCNGAGRLDP